MIEEAEAEVLNARVSRMEAKLDYLSKTLQDQSRSIESALVAVLNSVEFHNTRGRTPEEFQKHIHQVFHDALQSKD